MRKTGILRKTLSAVLALVFLLALMPVEARAVEIVDTGTCGVQSANPTWTLDSNGVMTIS